MGPSSETDQQQQTSTMPTTTISSSSSSSYSKPSKWLTKIFADDCVQKLINFYEQTPSSNLYFDYIAAKECLQKYQNEDYLVIHLNTLITFFIHVMYINKYPGRDKN
ncbi:unnamed protein product, partial [Rotaria sp. Silwood1]